jgi:hypothetical protein
MSKQDSKLTKAQRIKLLEEQVRGLQHQVNCLRDALARRKNPSK